MGFVSKGSGLFLIENGCGAEACVSKLGIWFINLLGFWQAPCYPAAIKAEARFLKNKE